MLLKDASNGWVESVEKFTVLRREVRRQRPPSESVDHLDLMINFIRTIEILT